MRTSEKIFNVFFHMTNELCRTMVLKKILNTLEPYCNKNKKNFFFNDQNKIKANAKKCGKCRTTIQFKNIIKICEYSIHTKVLMQVIR